MEEKQKKIIIIGAGISGLTTGIYGQNHGFFTEIFEKNPCSGGLCTSWERAGLPVDGCIHWLTGTKQDSQLRPLWDEVGAFKSDEIIYSDNFGTIEFDGKVITLWNDLKKLEKELIEVSPEDEKLIKKLIKYIVKIQNMHLPVEMPVSTLSIKDFLGVGIDMIPFLHVYLKCTNIQLSTFAKKFKSPVIQNAVCNIVPGGVNLYSGLYAFGSVASGNGGVLKGGSKTLVKNMENKYLSVGGKINFNSEILKIIVKDGRAIGIELKNGEQHFADYIVSATDPFNTLNLLPQNFDIPCFTKRINNINYPIPSCVLVSFKVDAKEKEKLGLTSTYEFPVKPFFAGNSRQFSIKLRDYSYDKTFIKNGKTFMNVLIPQFDNDYDYWNSFNKDDYRKAKIELGTKVLEMIVEKFPSLENKIELIDVCTHKTFERYVHSYRGSYQSFVLTAKGKMITNNGKVKGAKNLVLASQWSISPGGLPIALLAGKFAIQRILKFEKQNYKITKKIKPKFSI